MISTYDSEYKIVLVGDESVGKSSIIKRFKDDKYDEKLIKSIGVTLTHKVVNIQGKKVKLNLYDLSGQEKFHTIAPCVYNHSHALVLCFDVTNPQSYQNLCIYWLKELQEHRHNESTIFLMGNKIDEERKIQQQIVQQFAKSNNIQRVYYVSAKENKNIQEAFVDLATFLFNSPQKIINNHEAENCRLNHDHFQQRSSKCYNN